MSAGGTAADLAKLAARLRELADRDEPQDAAGLRAAARVLEAAAQDQAAGWIDCPETPPAPGWWWFRERPGVHATPAELWGHKSANGVRLTGVVGTWGWACWRAGHSGWQMWPVPIREPPTTPPAEKHGAPPCSLEQELRAWAEDSERQGDEHECAAAAEVMEIVDEWSRGEPATDLRYEPGEPDPEDVAEQGIADLVYELADVKRRIDEQRVRADSQALAAQKRAGEALRSVGKLAQQLADAEKRLGDHAGMLAALEDSAIKDQARIDRLCDLRVAERTKDHRPDIDRLRADVDFLLRDRGPLAAAQGADAKPRRRDRPCTCYVGACHRDRLGESWYCQLDTEPTEDLGAQTGVRRFDPRDPEEVLDAILDLGKRITDLENAKLSQRLDDHADRFGRIEERLDRTERARLAERLKA